MTAPAAYTCNNYYCNNYAKKGYNLCTPCYGKFLSYKASTEESYSSGSTGYSISPETIKIAIYIIAAILILNLIYALITGAADAANSIFHALPGVDEAKPACEMTGGLLGMTCNF